MRTFPRTLARRPTAARRPGIDGSGIRFLRSTPLALPYLFAAALVATSYFLPPSEWRLLLVSAGACSFNFATALLLWRRWSGAVAVFGLVVNYVLQSFFLSTMAMPSSMGHLWFFQPYELLIGNEERPLLILIMPSLAALTVLGVRTFFTRRAAPAVMDGVEIAHDPRLPAVLLGAAALSPLYWAGAFFEFGIAKALFETLYRTFMFVPFFAGFYFRVSRTATGAWIVALALNIAIGVVTGSRAPAFLPSMLYALGLIIGATRGQRFVIVSLLALLAVPGAYVFGMIEVVRSEVGRFSFSDLSGARISQVINRMADRSAEGRDDYERLPAWVRTNIRLVTWPTLVVSVAARGPSTYRGFDDLGQQFVASLNVVVLTGYASGYYNEGLFNLRASDYGFRVDEGTSVEFGMLAESWDRGGPLAAYAYSVCAILLLWGVESVVRRFLRREPALRAIGVLVIFATAYWTLNAYNLPLAMRHMLVNLLIAGALIVGFLAFAPKPAGAGNKPGRPAP